MLDERQIAEMERRMREEHQKDLEALERLKKYLPSESAKNGAPTRIPASRIPASRIPRKVRAVGGGGRTGLTKEVLAIITEGEQGRQWTRGDIKQELDRRGFAIRAKDDIAAVNQALKSLVARGEIQLLEQGSGSRPSVYVAIKPLAPGQ